jgi:hypothetical protein
VRLRLDRTIGAAAAIAATAAMVWASTAPMTIHGSNQGVLRLAWSARPERVEVCREQSAEELAKLPAHMRQPLVCEGTSARYRLTVWHEGRLITDRTLHGGGVRQDRRLYVFHELPLDPGQTSIEVKVDRIDEPGANVSPRAKQPFAVETVPPNLIFAGRVTIGPREVLLITYSPERRELIAIDRDRVER